MMARKAEPSPRRASATKCSSGECETSSRFFVAVCMPDLPESFVCFQSLLLRDGGQKLLACGRVLTKGAQHAARHHRDPVLANAARDIQAWVALTTTATPRGLSTSSIVSAIWAVSLSWTCSRRA